jgi:mannose-6-phosphate isomerase-like protein (cupin superfamily)
MYLRASSAALVHPPTGWNERQTEGMAADIVDLEAKFSLFSELWSPKLVARINDHEVKLVRLQGEFVWHTHEDTDELFLVVEGELTIALRDRDVVLGPGQLFVVPKGVEHCPRAEHEVRAVLLEAVGTVNTGEAGGDLTAVVEEI